MANNLGGIYSTGTASVGALGTVVTGTGTLWSVIAEQGDWFYAAGHIGIITETFDDDTLNLELPWTGGALSSQPYRLIKMSWLRYEPAINQQKVREFIADIAEAGIFHFVSGAEPDPGMGIEGQWALKTNVTPWTVWYYTGGVWVEQDDLAVGINPTGAWSAVTAYVEGDSVSLAGSSYVAIAPSTNQTPPNATYWQVLASKGDTGAAGVTAGILLTYDSTSTTDSDPTAGKFKLNHATPASATAAYLDNLDSGGATVSAILDLWDDSTATIRGSLRMQKSTDATVWAQWNVTGSVVDGTGYRKLTLASGAGSGAFTNSDTFSLVFSRTGDNGAAAPTYGGTSTTSLLIAIASKVFTTQAGLAYTNGARVRASSAANAANYMEGTVTYSGTTLTMTVDKIGGSGTLADWNFNIIGQPGSGDVTASNNGTEFTAATFATNLSLLRYAAQTLTSGQRSQVRSNINAPLSGHLFGLTLSAAGGSVIFGIASGQAADSTAVDLLVLGSAYTKTTSAWAVGTGNGAWDGTGTNPGSNDIWQHVFIIKRPDTGVVDILISASPTAPTLPTNYTLFRRIGSMKTASGVGVWTKFFQVGDEFYLDAAVLDYNSSLGTARSSITLTTPLGISCEVFYRVFFFGPSANAAVLFTDLVTNSTSVSFSAAPLGSMQETTLGNGAVGTHRTYTNTSSQIGAQSNQASSTLRVATYGWRDLRGRFA
jgi:hypothetical protein